MRVLSLLITALIGAGMSAVAAADLPVAVPSAAPAPFSWTGFHVGGHLGAGVANSVVADPFGASIYGDKVRSPGFLAGGQVGYDHQIGAVVLGIEAAASAADSDGTNTCFAFSGSSVSATCRARPAWYASVSGRLGYALGPTLLYARGGAAWTEDRVDIVTNRNPAGVFTSTGSVGATGWIAGAGVEYALTPSWSARFEYDYLAFGSRTVGTPYVGANPFGSAATTTVSPDAHQVLLGLNYRFGAAPAAMVTKAPPPPSGWSIEAGARTMYSWGRFQKDHNAATASNAVPAGVMVSRLTYDGMQTASAELFGRIDTPWDVFIKGFAGAGQTFKGHQNDEDSFFPVNNTVTPYTNSYSPKVDGHIQYAVADVGYDVFRARNAKVGAFAGYFNFSQLMNRYNCVQIANPRGSCTAPDEPPTPPHVVRFQELDTWQGLRLGVSTEVRLGDRLRLGAEVAYVPYLRFDGQDNHFRNPIVQFPASSNGGRGVQAEALLSYAVTDRFDVGIGARYWGLWTTDGTFNVSTSPLTREYRASVEQAGLFLQTSYRFAPGGWQGAPASFPVKAPLAVAHDWTGLYIGVAGGYVAGTSKHVNNTNDITPEFGVNGGMVGGEIGYNAQFAGRFVFGLEGDLSWSSASGGSQNQPPFSTAAASQTAQHALGTARLRLGATPLDRWLVYATGGLAIADVEASASGFSETHVRTGWTVGGGLEVALDRHWSAKAEYLYVDLNDTPYFTPPPAGIVNRGGGVPLRENVMRAGINYKLDFGAPVAARH